MAWLTYLRFDTKPETKTALVLCANEVEVNEVLQVARDAFGSDFTEYATFYAGRTIRTMKAPNFADRLIFTPQTLKAACGSGPPKT